MIFINLLDIDEEIKNINKNNDNNNNISQTIEDIIDSYVENAFENSLNGETLTFDEWCNWINSKIPAISKFMDYSFDKNKNNK